MYIALYFIIVPFIFSIYFFVKALISYIQRRKLAIEIIKSLREAKNKRNSELYIYSGNPGSGTKFKYKGGGK